MKLEKTWHDYLNQASLLLEKYVLDMDEVELAKKLFLINSKDREEETAISSSPKRN